MPANLVINTNVMSLTAQRSLSQTNKGLADTMERLSTGLRINSARDDAAGLAISERFTSQIKGLNQAMRNANDGVSFAQTAEGALSTIGNNLQRIRELAVQSSNATNSADDRRSLNAEVQSLILEISRVAVNTEFNGAAILDGSKSNLFFQVGANQGQMIAVTGVDSRTSKLGTQEAVGQSSFSTTSLARMKSAGVVVGAITITLNNVSGSNPTTIQSANASSLEEAVSFLNKAIQDRIDTDTAFGKDIAEAQLRAYLRVDNAGNTRIAVTGRFNTADSTTNASFFSVSGGNISIDSLNGSITTATMDVTLALTNGGLGLEFSQAYATGAVSARNYNLRDLNILTREEATQAIGIIDGALNMVNSMRADLGAAQNRFDTAITNMNVSSDNMSAAVSRIRDADFAHETAQLARWQILQQAGISVLSQANTQPQNALALLR